MGFLEKLGGTGPGASRSAKTGLRSHWRTTRSNILITRAIFRREEYGRGRDRWTRQWVPEGGLLLRGLLPKGQSGVYSWTAHGLKGRWHLVRMRPRSGEKTEPWLLIKSDDEFGRHTGDLEITDEVTTSQLSGRTNEELAARRGAQGSRGQSQGGQSAESFPANHQQTFRRSNGIAPVFLEPSLASQCEKPPTGPKWIHEIKYDGYRMQARIDGRTIRLLTRKKLDWTERFLSIADALKAIGLGSALIDGEIVVEMRAHFELQRLAGRSEDRPLGPIPLLRLRCSLLRRV